MSPAVMPAVYSIPQTHFDANTGPKGVIADAQSYERARKRTFRQTLYGMTAGVFGSASEKAAPRASSTGRRPSDRSARSSSEGSEDGEDEFMRSWREKRMLELKKGADVHTRRQSPSKRRWGRLVAVDPSGYLDAVEKVARDTLVVVLIADEGSSVSNMVENCVSNLARKYDLTRFVKLGYQDAEMSAATAPGLLAYRNGELVANLVHIIDEIPEGRSLSVTSLEDVLKQYVMVGDFMIKVNANEFRRYVELA